MMSVTLYILTLPLSQSELGGLCFRLLAGLVSHYSMSALFDTLYYACVLPCGFIYKAGPRAFCLKKHCTYYVCKHMVELSVGLSR
jgi:hypothetical protein